MEFTLCKRFVSVGHSVLDEGIAPGKIGLEFMVKFFEGHGGMQRALLSKADLQKGEAVLLLFATAHRDPVGLLGGAGHFVERTHRVGVFSTVLAEPFEAGAPKVFFRSICNDSPLRAMSRSR